MILYAETSAVLSWLLGEQKGETVRGLLATAEVVVASELTLVECDRVLIRASGSAQLATAKASALRARLNRAAAHWILLRLSEEILERARRPFPEEPIRTLDALHLASALETWSLMPETSLLALDHRVRHCGQALGFQLLPAQG